MNATAKPGKNIRTILEYWLKLLSVCQIYFHLFIFTQYSRMVRMFLPGFAVAFISCSSAARIAIDMLDDPNFAEACAGMHRDYLAGNARCYPDENPNTAEQNRHNTYLVRGLAARFAASAARVSEGHCGWVSKISISAQDLEEEAQEYLGRYQFCDDGENCLGVTGSGKLIVHTPGQGDAQHGEETEQRSVAEICSDMHSNFLGKIARCYPEDNPSTVEQNHHNSNLVRGIAALLAAGDARTAQGHCDWLSATSYSAQSLEEEAQEYLGQGHYRFCDDGEGCLSIDSSGQLSGQLVAHVAAGARSDEHGDEAGSGNVAEACAGMHRDYLAGIARCYPDENPSTAEQNRHNTYLVRGLAARLAASAARVAEGHCGWVSEISISAQDLEEEAQEYLGRYQFCDSGENCLGVTGSGKLIVHAPGQGDAQHGEETEQRSVAEICSDMHSNFLGKIARCYPEDNLSTVEQNRHNSNLVRGIAALLAAGDARMAQGHCDWFSATSYSAQSLEEEAQEYLGQGHYRFCDDGEGCLSIDGSGQLSGELIAN